MRNLFAVLCVIATAMPVLAGERISGTPRVLSGDRLEIGGRLVTLIGIDAPEQGQSCRLANGRPYDCGLVSRTALMDLTAGTTVSCELTGEAGDGAAPARCEAGGYDLSKGMVHTGWALAWPRQGTLYAAVEKASRSRRHGLWRGAFSAPWDWRAGRHEMTMTAVP